MKAPKRLQINPDIRADTESYHRAYTSEEYKFGLVVNKFNMKYQDDQVSFVSFSFRCSFAQRFAGTQMARITSTSR